MQSKKLDVRCVCGDKHNPECQETISSLAEKIFKGAKNLEVIINKSPLDFLTPLAVSQFRATPCVGCEGNGFINVADGPDDFEKVECAGCNGMGRVVAND